MLLNEYPDAKCILSGGKDKGEDITEAQAMYTWLLHMGIDSSRLYMEDQSKSTRENLSFSLKLIEDHHLSKDLIIVTNDFHEMRAGMIADSLNISHQSAGASTAWWLYPTYVVREFYGIIYQSVFR